MVSTLLYIAFGLLVLGSLTITVSGLPRLRLFLSDLTLIPLMWKLHLHVAVREVDGLREVESWRARDDAYPDPESKGLSPEMEVEKRGFQKGYLAALRRRRHPSEQGGRRRVF